MTLPNSRVFTEKEAGLESLKARAQQLKANREMKKLQDVATEFEALLINQMLKSMRKTINKNEMFHGGSAEDMFQALQDTEYSKIIANSEEFGLAESIVDSFKNNLEQPKALSDSKSGQGIGLKKQQDFLLQYGVKRGVLLQTLSLHFFLTFFHPKKVLMRK